MARPVNKSKAAAIESGARFYIGKQCLNQHAGVRYVSTNACRDCVAGKPAAWQADSTELQLVY